MRTLVLLAVSLAALAACGLRGELERPVPLWGNPPNEGPLDPRTIKAQEEKAAADKKAAADARAAREAEAARLKALQDAPPAPPR